MELENKIEDLYRKVNYIIEGKHFDAGEFDKYLSLAKELIKYEILPKIWPNEVGDSKKSPAELESLFKDLLDILKMELENKIDELYRELYDQINIKNINMEDFNGYLSSAKKLIPDEGIKWPKSVVESTRINKKELKIRYEALLLVVKNKRPPPPIGYMG